MQAPCKRQKAVRFRHGAPNQYCVGLLGRSSALQAEETGSIPVRSTNHAMVVLWVEHRIVYPIQAGSIPVHGAKFYSAESEQGAWT